MKQSWTLVSLQNQDVVPISSYDTAGSFLILGCNNGSIYYIGERTWAGSFGRRPPAAHVPVPFCRSCSVCVPVSLKLLQ